MRRVHAQRTWVAVVLLCAGVGHAGPRSAQATRDATEARALFARGQTFYADDDFPEALSAFLEAYDKKPLPLLLFNAAQAARRCNKFEQALDLYRRYLLAEPQAPERPQCERYIAELDALKTAPVVAPEPQPVVAPPVAVAIVAAPPAPPPARKRTGLIVGATIGGLVVVGGAIALGLVFTLHAHPPSSTLGTYEPFK